LNPVHIIGAGPAGSAAAIAALQHDASVRLFEKSVFPRHKVCGEFLSPEIAPVLDRLGVWSAFAQAQPAPLKRVNLYFGAKRKHWKLTNPGFGLSRYALDDLLVRHALACGATLLRECGVRECGIRESGAPESAKASPDDVPTIVAHGRQTPAPKGSRLFGFKAHFEGPIDDCVDLFFFSGCYAGVSAVENQTTNVCALAPETLLQAHGFQIDSLLERSLPLRERIAPLKRRMDWLITGPLVFRGNFHATPQQNVYCAGDALGFVDPFTGSGILAALVTGQMAGIAAARCVPGGDYLEDCRQSLGVQYRTVAFLRKMIQNGIAERVAGFLPGRLLFELTRPRSVGVGFSLPRP
jgi:flavin-dependent dehydrogenase